MCQQPLSGSQKHSWKSGLWRTVTASVVVQIFSPFPHTETAASLPAVLEHRSPFHHADTPWRGRVAHLCFSGCGCAPCAACCCLALAGLAPGRFCIHRRAHPMLTTGPMGACHPESPCPPWTRGSSLLQHPSSVTGGQPPFQHQPQALPGISIPVDPTSLQRARVTPLTASHLQLCDFPDQSHFISTSLTPLPYHCCL